MAEGIPARPPEGEPLPAASPAPVHATEATPDPAHAPAAVAPQPAKPRRKRRRWPYVVLALFLVLALLVVFAPTLAGTGPVRSFIVGQVNKDLTGKLQIDAWSLGWTSGARLNGVKLFDKSGSQILEVPRVTTELRLLDAVQGKLHFGKVTVEGLNALIRRDAEGAINFAGIVPPSDTPADTGPTKLPDLSGELHLVNCRATYEDQLQGQTFFFPSIAGQVKCPDINGAIDHTLDVAIRAGAGGTPGKLSVAGRLDVVEANEMRIDRAVVQEKINVQGVDLGSLAFLFGKDAPVQKLAGTTDGAVTVDFRGGESGTVEALLNSTNFALGGPALNGETFSTQKLTFLVPPTTVNMSGADPADWKTWNLRVGSGGTDHITLTIDQGNVRLAGDGRLQALLNLADNRAPGASGRVQSSVELDLGALARQMPKTFAVQEGTTLESGKFTHAADVELAADRATVRKLEVHLADVRGKNERGPISLQPVDLSLTAASFGGGWVAPDLRDLNLTLTSGFANAQFKGRDLSDLSGEAKGDLKRLQDELGQVVDFGDLRLAGPFDVRVEQKGAVVGAGQPAQPSQVRATVAVTDLVVEGLGGRAPLRQERVNLTADASIVRDASQALRQLNDVGVTLVTGRQNQPAVNAKLTVPVVQMRVGDGPTSRPASGTERVQSASLTADLDLAQVQSITDALAAPEPAGPVAQAVPAAAQQPIGSQVISRPRTGEAARAASPAPEGEAPPPPLRWGGATTVKVDFARQGERMVLTPAVTGRSVTVARGQAAQDLGGVSVNTTVSFVPAPQPAQPQAAAESPPITERIRDLQVPQFVAKAAGSEVTLAEPLVITDLPGLLRVLASFTDPKAPQGAKAGGANAFVRADGDIGRLLAVVKVINSDGSAAEGAEANAYSGRYALEQRLAAGNDGLALNGTMNVTDFAVADVDSPARPTGGRGAAPAGGGITERSVKLANDVTLDQARQSLSIRNLGLSMETTKALELQLSGNVHDFSTQRRLENVKGTLGYDWAKLWEIAKPMLSPETRRDLDLRVAGQARRTFTLGGSFPAASAEGRPLAFNESIRSLTGAFEGGFDLVEVNGMTIEKLELPLTLRDGVLTVASANKPDGRDRPQPAKLNGGELNLGGATLDLTGDTPRLSIPADTRLLAGSSLNPVFADKFGQFINNPAFVGAMDARGLLDVHIRRCDRLPLSGLVLKSDKSEAGIEMDFTIREMYLGGSKLLWALEKTGYVSFVRSSQWYIPEGHISIAKGKSRQNIVINVGETERPFRIEGVTDLGTQRLELTVTIPPRLLRQISRDVEKLFPRGLPIPVGGTLTAPAPDMQRVLPTLVQQGLVGGLLNQAKEQLENRRKDGKDDSPPSRPDDPARKDEQMEPEQPAVEPDPVKDLFDLVEKGIRDRGESDREKRERREQRQREREKQKR